MRLLIPSLSAPDRVSGKNRLHIHSTILEAAAVIGRLAGKSYCVLGLTCSPPSSPSSPAFPGCALWPIAALPWKDIWAERFHPLPSAGCEGRGGEQSAMQGAEKKRKEKYIATHSPFPPTCHWTSLSCPCSSPALHPSILCSTIPPIPSHPRVASFRLACCLFTYTTITAPCPSATSDTVGTGPRAQRLTSRQLPPCPAPRQGESQQQQQQQHPTSRVRPLAPPAARLQPSVNQSQSISHSPIRLSPWGKED